jgi:hypothetical protein
MGERRMAADHGWRLFIGLWAGLLLVKLWLAAHLPLFGDEAFYWLESRHPAPAYDDVPGLTPWLIGVGNALFGQSWLAVRLPFLAIGAFTAWWLAHCSAREFGRRAGAWSGILALLLPLFAVNGLLALPDVPLTLAVLACAEALRRLNRSAGRHGRWLLAAALALGWLSHYRFLVAFAAGGVWLLCDPAGRALLRRPSLWIAGLAGSAIGLAPLLWHQLWRGGSGFAFQFDERHPWRFQPEGLADPLLQALVVTPGLFLVLLWALRRAWRRRGEPAIGPLVWTGAALLLLYMLLAPFVDTERSRLHWPLPGWLLLAAVAGPVLVDCSARGRALVAAALALAAAGLIASFGWLALAAHAPQRLAAGPLYPDNFVGWPEIAARSAAELALLPADTVLAADNFMLAAQLSFALDGRAVYSLDHPANSKHGRQGELRRWRRDQAALLEVAEQRPVLLLVDETATRLRERPDWFRQLCERLPAAQPHFELVVHHGRRRFIGYLQQPGATDDCAPPALAYLHAPARGARLAGELEVSGWAIRDRAGIERLWLRIDGGEPIALPYGASSPGVQAMFPQSDDPNHPAVGYAGRFAPELAPGRHWLTIEAESADGRRSTVAATPFEWRP